MPRAEADADDAVAFAQAAIEEAEYAVLTPCSRKTRTYSRRRSSRRAGGGRTSADHRTPSAPGRPTYALTRRFAGRPPRLRLACSAEAAASGSGVTAVATNASGETGRDP
jgi:hypothetical protein